MKYFQVIILFKFNSENNREWLKHKRRSIIFLETNDIKNLLKFNIKNLYKDENKF